MGVFEKIKTGLEEAIAYECGTLEAVEKKYRIDMKGNPEELRALRCSPTGMEHPWPPCAEKSDQADR